MSIYGDVSPPDLHEAPAEAGCTAPHCSVCRGCVEFCGTEPDCTCPRCFECGGG